MATALRLLCTEPSVAFRLRVEEGPVPEPHRGAVLVRVAASSVNPIDAKRAAGYGRRLLALKGAGRFPLVLGNDVAGTVEAIGPGVDPALLGRRVFGVLPTGRWGAHATRLVAPLACVRPAPEDADLATLAALPYTFTTAWKALAAAGLAGRADGRRVLVHGAGGGLGRIALRLLARRGARVTAVCGAHDVDACRALGAETVIDRARTPLATLPADRDVTLNFATWDDDATLIDRLAPGRGGAHVTAVHPLLGRIDAHGLLRGGWLARRDHAAASRRAAARGASNHWVVFSPEPAALDELAELAAAGAVALPIGLRASLDDAGRLFRHVAARAGGRAVLDLATHD